MFDSLQERLGDVLGKLTRRGALSEADVTAALREVRVALLEADVALPVVKDFVAAVKEKAVGAEVLRSVAPGQQVIKIVHDHLVEMLGAEGVPLTVDVGPPAVLMLVGLQGSGKTTSCAKIAQRLTLKERKKVLMASLDVRRPAAQEQLRVLGEQIAVKTLPIVSGEPPVAIAKRAVQAGQRLWSVATMHNQLADQTVVIGRDRVAVVKRAVHSNTKPTGRMISRDRPRIGAKIGQTLGIDPNLDRVALKLKVVLRERKR